MLLMSLSSDYRDQYILDKVNFTSDFPRFKLLHKKFFYFKSIFHFFEL